MGFGLAWVLRSRLLDLGPEKEANGPDPSSHFGFACFGPGSGSRSGPGGPGPFFSLCFEKAGEGSRPDFRFRAALTEKSLWFDQFNCPGYQLCCRTLNFRWLAPSVRHEVVSLDFSSVCSVWILFKFLRRPERQLEPSRAQPAPSRNLPALSKI